MPSTPRGITDWLAARLPAADDELDCEDTPPPVHDVPAPRVHECCVAGDIVAYVADDGRLVVASWPGLEPRCSVPARWSFGGRRLAIHPDDDPTVVTASWDDGLCGYQPSGDVRWVRPDLRCAQVLAPVLGGPRPILAVLREGQRSLLLNPRTGREVGQVTGRAGDANGEGWLLTSTRQSTCFWRLPSWDGLREGPAWRRKVPIEPTAAAVVGDTTVVGGLGLEGRDPSGEVRWSAQSRNGVGRLCATGRTVVAVDHVGWLRELRADGVELRRRLAAHPVVALVANAELAIGRDGGIRDPWTDADIGRLPLPERGDS